MALDFQNCLENQYADGRRQEQEQEAGESKNAWLKNFPADRSCRLPLLTGPFDSPCEFK